MLARAAPAAGAHDKIVLIASQHSLTYEPVNEEISRIIDEENRRARSTSMAKSPDQCNILHPIRLDSFVFDHTDDGRPLWNHPYRDAVINRTIVDAVGWDTRRTSTLKPKTG